MTRDEAFLRVKFLMQVSVEQGHFSGREVAAREAFYAAHKPAILNNFRGKSAEDPWPATKQEELARQAWSDLQAYRTAVEVGTCLLRRGRPLQPNLAQIMINEIRGDPRPKHTGRYPRSFMFHRNYAIFKAVHEIFPDPIPALVDAFVLIADVLRQMERQPNTARTIENIFREMQHQVRFGGEERSHLGQAGDA